jgi:hypothetical protein
MSIDLQALAQEGAKIRLQQIAEEAEAIRQAFPDLIHNGSGMSAAQREAVSERMRAYWAKRRAEKG